MTPDLFTRKHYYTLFWSGGQGARTSTSMPLWDAMDSEFAGMTHEQAKQCSHKRLMVQGEMDHARAKEALEKASGSIESGAVPRLFQDSSDSDSNSADADEPQGRSSGARPSLNNLVRSGNDLTEEESSDLPLIVHPRCCEEECTKAGTYGMVQCNRCHGDLHRSYLWRHGERGRFWRSGLPG